MVLRMQLMLLSPVEVAYLFLAFIVTFLICKLSLPCLMEKMRIRGIVGVDAHKLDKPLIPEMGGLSLILAFNGGILLSIILFEDTDIRLKLIALLLSANLAGFVGVIDDLKTLGPKAKPLLTALSSIPLLAIYPLYPVFTPRPRLPIVGSVRLTYVYLFYVPTNMAVCSNTVNMLDVFNGAMPATTIIVFSSIAISSVILCSPVGFMVSIVMLGALAAYYPFNKYPAKVFSGDTGSLFVGSVIGGVAIIGGLEVVTVIALLPFIMNSFYYLASVKRLVEGRSVKDRPTRLLDNGMLEASLSKEAPITLARMVLARGALREPEVVYGFTILTLYSGILAVVTALLTFMSGA
ncbi:MAG: MraY family glycosyltransferase [Candidatus Freyarchaeota archaeon]|nr:hypothetical protein [Candidatus Freyrarchaeum guaymaensis]